MNKPQHQDTAQGAEETFIAQGYKAYNGYVFSHSEAEAYNRYTRDIARTKYPQTRQVLLDQRHAFFVATITRFSKKLWVVVRNPGTDAQSVVDDFTDFVASIQCKNRNPGADVMKRLENGTLTTEF